MKTGIATILLILAPIFSPLLSAQEKEDEGWKAFDYLLLERRDQENEILSHSLRPKISLEKSRTLGIGKIGFHIKSIDYDSKNARVWLDGEEFVAEVIIIRSNLLPREPSPPVKVEPGEKPNEFVDKRSKEEIEKAIRNRFDKMEEQLQARKDQEGAEDAPEETPSE